MRNAIVHILVVDDYEPFRRFLHLKLQSRPELQIVSEASDGLQAVQKAEELQPDVILLDISLPKLNGIEAARQIRKSAPQSRIIFVSQESSPDLVQEALSLGNCGYVVKSKADRDLLASVDAALESRELLGRSDLLTRCTPPSAVMRLQTNQFHALGRTTRLRNHKSG